MPFLPHWPVPNIKGKFSDTLDRMYAIMERLGNPHANLPNVVHVAGTNGKGSTIAFLKTILEKSGYKVHRYISPHLKNFNERIMLNSEQISDAALFALMEEVRHKCEDLNGTFFELTTAAAFLAFSRQKADFLLLETGMGGRIDATNVIEAPVLSVITPISFDHMEYLGDTLEKIALEKAHIIKKGCPSIISWQAQDAMHVISEYAEEMNSDGFAFAQNWNFSVNGDGFLFIDYISNSSIQMPKPSLLGLHQIINAATAVAAALYLSRDFDISFDDIAYGISHAKWPARLQRIEKGIGATLSGDLELWVDGAHNTGGAQMLSHTIEHLWCDKPTIMIHGRTGDRDIEGFLVYFKDLIQDIYCVKVVSEPKGESAEKIAACAASLGFNAVAKDSILEAIEEISTKYSNARILVCGSLYLATDVERAL